ncbi:MAG: hypothetical protein ACLTEE_08970 [Anaerobutyricum hallii]
MVEMSVSGLSKRCYKRICIYIYMEKFQKMIADLTLATGEQVHLSASAGGAAFPEGRGGILSHCVQKCRCSIV